MKPPKNHGGKRAGAGRPPEWLKTKCANIIDKKKLVEFLGRVADGSEKFTFVNKEGDTLEISPAIKDRLHAVEMLLDRGFGKATSCEESTLVQPLQKVINETALLKMIYALTYPERNGTGANGSDPAVMERRNPSLQA